MINEKKLIERLEENQNIEMHFNGEPPRQTIDFVKAVEIVNQLAEEYNKKYEPTIDLIKYGVEGYNLHLKEQYEKGYADGWHDCSCTIPQPAPK